ncbi:MAG: hypothetical protein K2Q26_11240 [Bdellovibrionales bacterium]|nr:hypothetical protein [Bdellovibrionales bacterium]
MDNKSKNPAQLHFKPGDDLELFAKIDGETCPWIDLTQILPEEGRALDALTLFKKNLESSHSLIELLHQMKNYESVTAQGVFMGAVMFYGRFFNHGSPWSEQLSTMLKSTTIHHEVLEFYKHAQSFAGSTKFESAKSSVLLHPRNREIVGVGDYSVKASFFDDKFLKDFADHLSLILESANSRLSELKKEIHLKLRSMDIELLYGQAIYGDLPIVI